MLLKAPLALFPGIIYYLFLLICIEYFHLQHIPPGFLLPKWPLYFSTLNLYLMHPASTVRQATSVAFKYLGKVGQFLMIINIIILLYVIACDKKEECSPNAEWSDS